MTMAELNALPAPKALELFLQCCGSHAWARAMTERRPFADRASLSREAVTIWRGLDQGAWRQAFAAHPRIGESPAAGKAGRAGTARAAHGADQWASKEQSGMDAASDALRRRIDRANHDYEARFGFIYLVCASGKTAEELLAALEVRLTHARDEELRIAAEEQRKITELRLEKLLS